MLLGDFEAGLHKVKVEFEGGDAQELADLQDFSGYDFYTITGECEPGVVSVGAVARENHYRGETNVTP